MHHILIVDDNLTNLEQINIQLEDDYVVSLAKSGEQALEICRRTLPDLVLLDIEMPGMDGFETLAALRADPATRGIPVIFLTASPDPRTELAAIRAGASDFITKPAEGEVLHHRVGAQLALAQSEKRRDLAVQDFEDRLISAFADIIEHRGERKLKLAGKSGRYVGILAGALAREGAFPGELTERAAELMARAAPLHDIGKIGVPDVILLKPSSLKDEEFAVMKTHTVIGEEHLRGVFGALPRQDFHPYALAMARSHHERWDGKGYPDGLKGGEIPLCARIMAVCDVFDALTDTRAYKRPMSAQDALRIVGSGSGTLFDPAAAAAFLREGGAVAEAAEGGGGG
jgi:putative two-component system response regulator